MEQDAQPSREELIERTGRNLAGALAELAELATTAEQQSRAVRRGIVADVRALMAMAEGSTETELASAVVEVANRLAPQLGVTPSPADILVPLSKPVFGTADGCLGRPGVGVTAEFGSVSVSMCVAGSLSDGLSGGGFELTVRY